MILQLLCSSVIFKLYYEIILALPVPAYWLNGIAWCLAGWRPWPHQSCPSYLLTVHHGGESAVLFRQLVIRSAFQNTSLADHHDAVTVFDGGNSYILFRL